MKKLARRQNEDSQQSGVKDKKNTAAAGTKNSSKRSGRDDELLRQLTLISVNCWRLVSQSDSWLLVLVLLF